MTRKEAVYNAITSFQRRYGGLPPALLVSRASRSRLWVEVFGDDPEPPLHVPLMVYQVAVFAVARALDTEVWVGNEDAAGRAPWPV